MSDTGGRERWSKVGLGRLAYQWYYRPIGLLKNYVKVGPLNVWLTRRGEQAMAEAVGQLPPMNEPSPEGSPEVHFLTGRGHWFLTAFCGYSLLQNSSVPLRLVLHDDGSMDTKTRAALSRVLPTAEIIGHEQMEAILDQELPRDRFPSLRERRLRFPLLRKLMDVHVGRQGWRMFLDSDMLFFREPTAMLDWLRTPGVPCYMADFQYAYGYAEDVMSSLVGKPIPPRINTGICGLKSDAIDWDRIEQWQRALQAVDGGNHFQEQALTAMIMADGPHFAFPREDYLIMPSREEVLQPTAVMHHYVWQARPLYFRYAWHHVVARAAQPITAGRSE